MIVCRRLRLAVVCAGALLVSAASASQSKLDPRNVPAHNTHAASAAPAVTHGLGMALLAANVDSDATLLNGAGTTGATSINTGIYEVDFNRDVSSCFYTANSFSYGESIEVEPRSGNPKGVFIAITNDQNSNVSNEFYLTVFCAN